MTELTSVTVYRAGATKSLLWSTGRRVDIDSFSNSLSLFTSIASKGGGDTSIRIDIGKADFPLLWQSMTEADQTATLRAMLGELKRRDRVLRRRKEIARMAQDAGFKG